MTNLILKQANDKSYCLFGWDAAEKAMKLIAEGPFAKEVQSGYRFLVEDNEKKFRIYRLKDDELDVLSVYSEKVEIIGDTCICQHNDRWYAFIDGKEILLGEKRTVPYSMQMKLITEKSGFYYFILGDENKEFTLSIIDKDTLFQKVYAGPIYPQKEAFLFVSEGEKCYDVFKDGSVVDGKYADRFVRDDARNVYFWSEEDNAWVFVADNRSSPAANNALLTWYKDEVLKTRGVILYRVEGVKLIEEARGKEVDTIDAESFCIGGKIYTKDAESGFVDFQNPQPTRWQKFLRRFRK